MIPLTSLHPYFLLSELETWHWAQRSLARKEKQRETESGTQVTGRKREQDNADRRGLPALQASGPVISTRHIMKFQTSCSTAWLNEPNGVGPPRVWRHCSVCKSRHALVQVSMCCTPASGLYRTRRLRICQNKHMTHFLATGCEVWRQERRNEWESVSAPLFKSTSLIYLCLVFIEHSTTAAKRFQS